MILLITFDAAVPGHESIGNTEDMESVYESHGEILSDSNYNILYLGFDATVPDHESIGNTEDMESVNESDEGTITDEHISPRVRFFTN